MNPPSTEVSSKSYTNLPLFFYAKKESSPANKSHELKLNPFNITYIDIFLHKIQRGTN